MPVREMAKPIPVLTGSEYRDRKTMKKQVRQNRTGMIRGTWGGGHMDASFNVSMTKCGT